MVVGRIADFKTRHPIHYWGRMLMLAFWMIAIGLLLTGNGAQDVDAAGESDRIVDFSADIGDAYLNHNDAVYNTGWTDTDASAVSGGVTLNLGQRFFGGIYYFWRPVLVFDTSTIDDTENVTAAWIQVKIYGDNSDTEFYVVAQTGSGGHPSFPIVVGDYDKSFYSGNERYLSTSVIAVDGLYSIPINPALINLTAETLIYVRSSRDVDGTSPTGNEFISFYSGDHGTSEYHPKLTVVFNSTYAEMATNTTASDDGYAYKQDPVYLTAWNALTGTATLAHVNVGNNLVVADFRIDRGFAIIDTAGLPDGLNLSLYNATLLVYLNSMSNTQEFSVYVQNGQPTYPHLPIVAGDYAKGNYAGGVSGGNLANTSTLVAGNWYDIQFTSSWVTLDGETKLCLRSDRDIYGGEFPSDSWLTLMGDETPYRSMRLVLDLKPVTPDPEPEPEPTETTVNWTWWGDAGCISSVMIVAVVLLVGFIFIQATTRR